MIPDKPRITARIAGRALHPLLHPFAPVYFLAACGCDLIYSQASVYAQNSAPEFASITAWLLVVGLVMSAITAMVALIDYLGDQCFRDLPDAGLYALGTLLVGVIELYNLDIRWSDGTAGILPSGLAMSLSAVIVLLATPSRSWARIYRQDRRR